MSDWKYLSNIKPGKSGLKRNQFSRPQIFIFAVVFALSGIVIWRSLAAPNPSLPGDLNNDNTVNITDMSILLSNYGTPNATADINSDGTVSILDLSILLSHYGQTYTPPTTDINVKTQFGTTDSAIRSAISAAKSQGKGLYFPAATYNYSSKLTFSGLKVHGDGDTTIFLAATKSSMALTVDGSGTELRSLKISCPQCELPSGPPTAARLSTGDSAGVFILPTASNFVVDHVTVDHAGSAGILNWGGSYGTITNNHILNTLADAIHNTNGANNIEVAYNNVYNSGDDMFAVVSYLSDGKISHDIKIHDNVGDTEPWGRGATVVGGDKVQIYNNSISHTYGAAIYVEAEGGTYNTYGDSNITISNNTIRNPDQGNIHNCNIKIGTYNTTQTTTNVMGTGNNLDRSKPGLNVSGNYSTVNVGWAYGN
jgi:hypothetical protein